MITPILGFLVAWNLFGVGKKTVEIEAYFFEHKSVSEMVQRSIILQKKVHSHSYWKGEYLKPGKYLLIYGKNFGKNRYMGGPPPAWLKKPGKKGFTGLINEYIFETISPETGRYHSQRQHDLKEKLEGIVGQIIQKKIGYEKVKGIPFPTSKVKIILTYYLWSRDVEVTIIHSHGEHTFTIEGSVLEH